LLKMRWAAGLLVRPPSSQSVTSLSLTSNTSGPMTLFQRLDAAKNLVLQQTNEAQQL
jgi:hypothetical protein